VFIIALLKWMTKEIEGHSDFPGKKHDDNEIVPEILDDARLAGKSLKEQSVEEAVEGLLKQLPICHVM
jgi:hypothetical protein